MKINNKLIKQTNVVTASLYNNEQQLTPSLNYDWVKLDTILNTNGYLNWELQQITPSGSQTQAKGIKIPKGVSKLNVSCTMQFNNNNGTSAMYFIGYIYKIKASDGSMTMYSRSITPSVDAGKSASVTNAPYLISVNEGDVIVLRAYKSLATSNVSASIGNGVRTYLTLEVVN